MIKSKKERILLPPERKRDKQLKIWVSQEEQEMIHQKMAEFGTTNLGAFVRKMVIDGYIVKLDMPELKEIIRLLSITSSNVNQIARQLHSTGSIYQQDISEVQKQLEQNYKVLKKVMVKLSSIH